MLSAPHIRTKTGELLSVITELEQRLAIAQDAIERIDIVHKLGLPGLMTKTIDACDLSKELAK